MLKNRIIRIGITFILTIVLSILTQNAVIGGVVTFVNVIAGYIIISHIRHKKRLNLIEDNCDPQAFIEATADQKRITGKNSKINAYLTIDIAAGLIILGEFQKAKDILLSIDKAHLSVKNGTLLIYTINLIACLYELGDIEQAEKIFETQMPLLPPVGKKISLRK